MHKIRIAIAGGLVPVLLLGCQQKDDAKHVEAEMAAETVVKSAQSAGSGIVENPTRDAFFGDLHVHTSNSFDAFVFGVRRTPEDAYRFAMGQPIPHDGGGKVQLSGPPLDFYAVTDHGEYLGVVPAMADPDNPLSQTETAKAAFGEDAAAAGKTFQKIGRSFVTTNPIDDIYDRQWIGSTWQKTVAAAEQFNRPGEFTTFAAYEFTAMKVVDIEQGGAANLHRNVIFKGDAPEEIFTTLQSGKPQDLWSWMEGQRAEGRDSLAIPHNSNGSNGWMFALVDDNGNPIAPEVLASRHVNEPLVEITQIKGTSDTRPLFSPDDEWADFEYYPYLIGSRMHSIEAEGSYVRPTLGVGVEANTKLGVNPFEFGVIGSSDTHIAAGNYVEENYSGKFPQEGRDPKLRGSVPAGPEGSTWADSQAVQSQDPHVGATAASYSASGLAGVWAESNTRDALFAAMKRRETFGTSGPRMRVRFFAGSYEPSVMDDADLLTVAYRDGVPMGGKLADQSDAPTMLVWAAQDPLSAPLQRAQVVKVWRDNGEHRERVFDVACSGGEQPDAATYRCPDNGASVDIASCEQTMGTGASELKSLWRDPEFSQEQSAVYFVRVLENPTCRWSTWDAARAGTPPNPDLPETLQERAWSSPIWVN